MEIISCGTIVYAMIELDEYQIIQFEIGADYLNTCCYTQSQNVQLPIMLTLLTYQLSIIPSAHCHRYAQNHAIIIIKS